MDFLLLITVIVLIAFVLLVLLYTVAAKLLFVVDTDTMDVGMKLTWLNPLFRAFVRWDQTRWLLTVCLFGMRVYSRALNGSNTGGRRYGKYGGTHLVREVRPTDIHVRADYGFRDPYTTGMACSAVNMATQMVDVESICQQPDFCAAQDYIHFQAVAKLNVAQALLGVFKARRVRATA